LVREQLPHHPSQWAAISAIAPKLGCTKETLRRWLLKAEQDSGAAPSVGSVGDAYDNALAETVIGLFKTEVVYRDGPWRGFEDVEMATLEWVASFNQERLLAPLGHVPPAEFEAQYHDAHHTHSSVGVLN
jgi:transposase InsO family protein